jgi:hypothetical protein
MSNDVVKAATPKPNYCRVVRSISTNARSGEKRKNCVSLVNAVMLHSSRLILH